MIQRSQSAGSHGNKLTILLASALLYLGKNGKMNVFPPVAREERPGLLRYLLEIAPLSHKLALNLLGYEVS